MTFLNRLPVLLLLLAACNNQPGKTPDITGDTTDTVTTAQLSPGPPATEPPIIVDSTFIPYSGQDKPYDGQYCYITGLTRKDNTWYIDADYIQFYMGNEALEAAKKQKDANFEVTNDGDTVYDLPDDYYIVNENTKKRTLPLDKEVTFLAMWHVEGKPYYKPSAITELETGPKNPRIYILTINSNGAVTRIQQQYLP